MIAGFLSGLLVAAAFVVAFRSGDDDSSGRREVSQDGGDTTFSEPEPLSDHELCVEATRELLNEHVRAVNAGDELYIFRIYGASDPRTQALVRIHTTFQGEIYRVGETQANINNDQRLSDYCTEYPYG